MSQGLRTQADKSSGFAVRLAVFEGPLELLLSLIERHELPISAVSLAAVTDQFLEHLASGQGIDIDQIADYLVIAAKLVLIKSQSLLPRPPSIPTSEDDYEDPLTAAEALAQQIKEYRRFKIAADWLRLRDETGLRSYPRRVPGSGTSRLAERPLLPIQASDLLTTLVRVLRRYPPLPDEPSTRSSVAEQIQKIEHEIAKGSRLVFRTLFPMNASADLLIAALLAVLDLVKRGRIEVRQDVPFGEIVLTGNMTNDIRESRAIP